MEKGNVRDVDLVWTINTNGDWEETILKDVKEGMIIKVEDDANHYLALSDPRMDIRGNIDVDVDELSRVTH